MTTIMNSKFTDEGNIGRAIAVFGTALSVAWLIPAARSLAFPSRVLVANQGACALAWLRPRLKAWCLSFWVERSTP